MGNPQVYPAIGRRAADRASKLMFPVNPPLGVIVTVAVPVVPAVNDIGFGALLRLKSATLPQLR